MDKEFYILAIDGGGYRGVYAAHILKRIEEEFGESWVQRFGLIAGTSTGAIIAASLASGIPASQVVDFYKDHGERIFPRSLLPRCGALTSKYSNEYLKTVLKQVLGNDVTLGQIGTPLILPSTDIGNGAVHVFKSSYDKEFVRDKNRLLYKAVLASCSAPTYFDPYAMDNYLLADGGLWANNPALVAAVDAKRRLEQRLENLRILSIGTGEERNFYSMAGQNNGWGLLSGWGGQKFIRMLLNLQAQTANNMLGLLLESNQILRINFKSDKTLKLDDPKEHNNLVSLADHDFTYNAEKIKQFMKYGGANDKKS